MIRKQTTLQEIKNQARQKNAAAAAAGIKNHNSSPVLVKDIYQTVICLA